MNLKELLKNKKNVDLEVSSFEKTLANDGQAVVILHLKNPIPVVTGSQSIQYEGQSVGLVLNDVETVKVRQNVFEDQNFADDFQFNEDGSGTVKTDMFLDVAKRTLDAWITPITFRQFGRNQVSAAQTSTASSIMEKLRKKQEEKVVEEV